MTELAAREFDLEDRYGDRESEVFLTGLQALVRLPLEQSRRDAAAGHNAGILISGYEGSPLAGYDLELSRQNRLLAKHRIEHRPGVNEELAANAVQGSQLASAHAERTVDGVVGIWYGKAPGLDRATDALRHANLGGSDPRGGALVLVGDDSIAKSSTVPSSSETAMAELGLPILVPGDPQEILDLGLHGIALSRFSGLWVGMKLATNVVDGSATVRLGTERDAPVEPSRLIDDGEYRHEVSAHFMQPNLGRLEQSLQHERHELALRYVRANGLNTVVGDPRAALGIITSGIVYRDVLEALGRLGIDNDRLAESGVRILKLGAIAPLDPDEVRRFANGLTEIVVVEEKRAFVELAVKSALFDAEHRVRVVGKTDPDGRVLIRAHADLPPEYLASALRSRLETVLPGALRATGGDLPGAAGRGAPARTPLPLLTRTPYFCSGCPHNRSTVVPEGSLVGAGIGCHGIATLMDSDRVGEIVSLAQMGGEGAPWIGMSPFVKTPHIFQNLGDGTFHHSGSLAIRAAVAAGVNITYKLLYNDAVAMTGGQAAVGKMSVPMIVRELLAEGAAKVAITTDDTAKYRRVRLPKGVAVHDRSRLLTVQEEMSRTAGVTVLIHDQECATELRRKRKRGQAADPAARAFINERVCEGCGDCGQKSNCMSVQPVETDFGRKTRIDQATCNKDYSCFDGDCPSFVKVIPGRARERSAAPPLSDLPDPQHVVPSHAFNVRITGVGGTGVVTAAQILATAGTLAGFHVRGLDQLGLAQKGGAVVSDLRFSMQPIEGANKIAPGDSDLYLGCDALVATAPHNLTAASSARTVAVVSTSKVPTGAMILDPSLPFPSTSEVIDSVGGATRAESVFADVRALARQELGSDQLANMVLVGMAYQSGALPIPIDSLERAIRMNGAAIDANLRAIAVGRRQVADPVPLRSVGLRSRSRMGDRGDLAGAVGEIAGIDEALRDRLGFLAAELADYQDSAYALRFLKYAARVAQAELAVLGSAERLVRAGSESMFKLMAYKDEYEVARLYLDPTFRSSLAAEFGDSATFAYQLHPPLLRALGMKRKLSLGRWFTPALRLLKASRRLRGTRIDPFGFASVRRMERGLIREFDEITARVTARVTSDNVDRAESILAMPQQIRGYEHIKIDSVRSYRQQIKPALTELGC